MRHFLFLILLFILFSWAHSAKAEVYFSQPNSNGYVFYDYIYLSRNGHSFVGDDGSTHFFGSGYGQDVANFLSPTSAYPLATTSVTSYVTDVILYLRDTNKEENQDYRISFECDSADRSYGLEYQSSYVNSSNFSTDSFVAVDFHFPNPNCDLSKYEIHQFMLINSNFSVEHTVQDRVQNTDSIPDYGVSNNNGNVVEDYEAQMTILDSIPATKPIGKTPVLIIPGVMGTNIVQKNGDKLWLDLAHNVMDVGDEFMDDLQFKTDLTPSTPDLISAGVIKKEQVNLGAVKIKVFDYTDGLTTEFKSQGYTEGTTPDATLFTFPYDWRYGVSGIMNSSGSTTVDLLQEKIQEIRLLTGSNKVDVIAHSTGGLLVKKYVMDHPTDNYIGKAVFVGVPNWGAPNAVKVLLVGDSFGDQFFLSDGEMKKVAQNLPVIYDLSPSEVYYNSEGSFYHFAKWDSDTMTKPETKDLSFSETYDRLKNNFSANGTAISNAQNLHTANFDSYDIRNGGVDLYNIVGCKSATMGKVYEYQSKSLLGGTQTSFEGSGEISGDGTVPFASADSIVTDAGHTFFVPKAEHSKMPSEDGIRQEIVNLISGSGLSTNGKVLEYDSVHNSPKLCEINGEQINIKSPVSINITDQDGNISGIASDGSIQNNIPGADYQVWGEHKFVFLPTDEGQAYDIELAGTGTGTFTLEDQSINGTSTIRSQTFSNIPVTPSLTGQVNLGGEDGQTTLSLVNAPGSEPVTVNPDIPAAETQSDNESTPPAPAVIPASSGGGSWVVPIISPTSSTSTIAFIPPIGEVLSDSTSTPVHGQGSLVADKTGTVYLIVNSVKHPFTSAKRFLQLGFKFKDVAPIFPGDSQFMLGMPM